MKRFWPFVLAALGVCLLLATLVSPFASGSPDGLERVAEDQGFLERAEGGQVWNRSPVPDYEMPGVKRGGIATALAGAAGTLVVFGLALGIGRLLSGRRAATRRAAAHSGGSVSR